MTEPQSQPSPEPDVRSFDGLREIVRRLRAPDDGCPWDRVQTHESLRRYLLEETYEVLETIDDGSPPKLREELGDLLLQIMLHAQIASESGEFDIGDVIEGIATKLLRRHPHVFGETKLGTAEEVVLKWEAIKSAERGGASLLADVPAALPSLAYSQALQERAVAAGFEWPTVDDVLDKLTEEARELAEAQTLDEQREELGDTLFVLVSLARKLGLDAEESLRLASRRFRRRFDRLQALAAERGLRLADLPIEAMESLWRETKSGA
jgi:tetrapyrrole methylase family protein / MazG family protein